MRKLSDIHNIVIIEDNDELRELLSMYIKNSELYHLAGSYANCEAALQNMAEDNPRVVLMDIRLPGMDGVKGTALIKAQWPEVDVLIISVFENSEVVFDALCAGATGYLSKQAGIDNLIESLNETVAGGAPMSMKIARMVVGSFNRNPDSPLTQRETEVLSQLALGKSYKGIADQLSLSKDTVKFHIKNIYIKLQVENRAQAIERANKDRLI